MKAALNQTLTAAIYAPSPKLGMISPRGPSNEPTRNITIAASASPLLAQPGAPTQPSTAPVKQKPRRSSIGGAPSELKQIQAQINSIARKLCNSG